MRRTTVVAAALAAVVIAGPAAAAGSWPHAGRDAARTNRTTAVSAQAPRLVPGWPLVRAWGADVWVDPAGQALLNPWNDPRDGVLNADGTFRSIGAVRNVRSIGPDGRRYTIDVQSDRVAAWSPSGALLWRARSVDIGPEASDRFLLPGPDGMLYEGGFQGWVAYDPSGNVAWTVDANMENQGTAIAVASDGSVVIGIGGDTATPRLQRMRPDGTVLWTVPLTGQAVDVAVTDGGLVVTTHSGTAAGGAGLRAYRLADGAPAWSVDTGRTVPSTPAITADGGVLAIVGRTLRSIGPDGTPRWSLAGGFQAEYAGGIVIGGDGTSYVGGTPLTAVRPDGTVLWRAPYGGRLEPSSIGTDGTLYAGWYDLAFAFAPPGARSIAIPAAPARPLVSGANLSARRYRVQGQTQLCPSGPGSCRPSTPLGARLGVRLSRDANVTIEVRRAGERRVWGRSARRGVAGANWFSMLDVVHDTSRGTVASSAPLAPGRYTVTLRAAAGAAPASTRPLAFTVAGTPLRVAG